MAVALTLSGQVKASRPTELFRAPIPPERRQTERAMRRAPTGVDF